MSLTCKKYLSLVLPFCFFLLFSSCKQNNENADLAKKIEALEKKIEANNNMVDPPKTTDNPKPPVSPTPVLKVDTIYVDKPCPPDATVQSNSISVNPTKMNVLYLGVVNPIHFDGNFEPSDLRVNGSGAGISLRPSEAKSYSVTVSQPGEGNIRASAGGTSINYPFRAKRIPDPVARISNSTGGSMGRGEFKAQGGLGAFLDEFDFDAVCQVVGFNLTRIAKRQDPVESINSGPRFNAQSTRLISMAKPGDIYLFTNVRAKCPGDSASRKINTIVIQIQ